MTAPDDERVVSLLRDAVPPVPDAPERLAAVRSRAGHQRARLWSQTIGAAASVLLVVGVAAAVAAPRPGEVRPSSRPLAHLAEKLAKQTSVSFALTSRRLTNQAGMPQGTATTSTATGAYSRTGDLRIDGDLAGLGMFLGEIGEMHVRGVGGATYRNAMPFDHAPAGKRWVRQDDSATPPTSAEIERLVTTAVSVARDVHYVRTTEVRGVEVAEYVLTVPGQYLGGVDLPVTFALDADGLPRRLSADVPLSRIMGGVTSYEADGDPSSSSVIPGMPEYTVHAELDLFDYGVPVDVTAPPASEVITEADLAAIRARAFQQAQQAYEACLAKTTTRAGQRACATELGKTFGLGGSGFGSSGTITPDGCTTEVGPDGSHHTTCSQRATIAPYAPGSPGTSGSSGGTGRIKPLHASASPAP